MSQQTMSIEQVRELERLRKTSRRKGQCAPAIETQAPSQPHLAHPVSFFVPGKPETAGSKRAIPLKNHYTGQWLHAADGRPIINVIDDNPKSQAWKKAVAAVARQHYHDDPVTCPIHFSVLFTLERPQGHFGTGKNTGAIKPSARKLPTVKPDVLKLCRAVEDALSKLVWVDDSQIISYGRLKKQYGNEPGVEVLIEEIASDDAAQGTLFDTGW